ncbi:LysM peptidoglycan-binding domain-containing protein [Flavobacterium sp. LS1R49]|uniref:LysM peptidoglycan-binding domain-containing protein n=1 Tax=Flavobacterium shii TaxID=2987687 RepID=A0A9X2ZGA6_9FLAO|nr:LysM domain-containing protein [Flavobacterium shii]MCV9930140.1 LysM peptidoglycan-binding domain-containing protein [Flavobacterium shii]
MILETYKVVAEEKLVELAAKFNITPEEIKRLNPNTRFFKAFFGPEYVAALQHIQVPVREIVSNKDILTDKKVLDNLTFDQEARYRCEQTVITKINGITQNHANTKTEFLIGKQATQEGLFVKVQMIDNILQMQPAQLGETITLLNGVENVKSDATFMINPHTGKIIKVMNHNEIIEKWRKHKEYLNAKYDFIRLEQNRESYNQFMILAGNQIVQEDKLIIDLESKLFYQLFFDKYLVTNKDLFASYRRPFYSQLFTGTKLGLDFKQDILSEYEDGIVVRKVGTINPDSYDDEELEEMYNRKFKPLIKYQFSEFSFSYRERSVINTKDRWIESAEVTMIEQVKNNIQILVEYKLKKIDI